MLDRLRQEADRGDDVRAWLAYLSRDARSRVAGRLFRSGHLRAVVSRRFLGPAVTTFVPADPATAAWPWLSLSTRLRGGLPLDVHQACLAGLVLVTGLDAWLLDGASPAASSYLRRVAAGLSPRMRELLAHTRAGIGAVTLVRPHIPT